MFWMSNEGNGFPIHTLIWRPATTYVLARNKKINFELGPLIWKLIKLLCLEILTNIVDAGEMLHIASSHQGLH